MKQRKRIRILIWALTAALLLAGAVCPAGGERAPWDCPECGRTGNTGNFCGGCGCPAPEEGGEANANADEYNPPEYVDQSGDFTYKARGTYATISKYTGRGGTVFIPATLEGKPVRRIPDKLFAKEELRNVTCVVIPEGVTEIGSGLFNGNDLEEIYIPASVVSIGDELFTLCGKLTHIRVSPENPKYTTVDGVLFTRNMETLVAYPAGREGKEYTVPEGVKTIAGAAFSGAGIHELFLPDSLTTIGKGALANCESLKTLTIPAGVTAIDANAFGTEDRSLTRIDVAAANRAYSSADGVLFDKNMTILIQYPNSREDDVYVIPDTVTFINRNAFEHSRYLRQITLSAGLTNIIDYLFNDCRLERAEIPEGIIGIGNYAFGKSPGIHVVIPASVTMIGKDAFAGCGDYTIEGKKGSYAEEYAKANGVSFVRLTK